MDDDRIGPERFGGSDEWSQYDETPSVETLRERPLAVPSAAELRDEAERLRSLIARMEAELERMDERLEHARFMARGWRQRARASRQNALTALRWCRRHRATRARLESVAIVARAIVDRRPTDSTAMQVGALATALAALQPGDLGEESDGD